MWVGKHLSKLSAINADVETCLATEDIQEKFPLVVEATGSTTGLEKALHSVQTQGTVVLKTTVANPHEIDLSSIVINEVQLLGSRCGRFAPALEALAEGRVDPSFLIEASYPLEKALEAFEHAARPGAAKVLITLPND